MQTQGWLGRVRAAALVTLGEGRKLALDASPGASAQDVDGLLLITYTADHPIGIRFLAEPATIERLSSTLSVFSVVPMTSWDAAISRRKIRARAVNVDRIRLQHGEEERPLRRTGVGQFSPLPVVRRQGSGDAPAGAGASRS